MVDTFIGAGLNGVFPPNRRCGWWTLLLGQAFMAFFGQIAAVGAGHFCWGTAQRRFSAKSPLWVVDTFVGAGINGVFRPNRRGGWWTLLLGQGLTAFFGQIAAVGGGHFCWGRD